MPLRWGGGAAIHHGDADALPRDLGACHRAALSITEGSDAMAVVVSEETGDVSVACDGKLMRHLDLPSFEETLTARLRPKPAAGFHVDRRLRRPGRK